LTIGQTIRKALNRALEQVSRYLYWVVAAFAIAVTVFVSGLICVVSRGVSNLSIVSTAMVGESLILAIITCLAAIIPIVFSVSMLAIQHAAGNYTASVLEEYKRDRKTWFFYALLAFGVFFASVMLIADWSVLILSTQTTLSLLNAGFSILVFSLLLLPLQLVHITDLINPKSMIGKAKESCVREILSTRARLSSILAKAKPRNELERRITQMPSYPEYVFHQNLDALLKVAREKVLQIMDIVFKSAVKREAETYSIGFEAISEISRTYVSIRKEDSTRDDKFLQYIYDKLLSIPRMALDTGDVTLLQAVITAIENVGRAAAEIKPASPWSPNLMASVSMWYIHDIGTRAIERGLWDSVAEAIRSIKNIGVSTIKRARDDGSASTKILNLGRQAISKGEWIAVNVASGALSDLLCDSVRARIDVNHVPARILEAIDQLSVSAIDNNLDWQALTGLFPVMPEYSIERAVWIALELKNEPHPDEETAYREGYAWETVSALLDTLANVGIKAAQKKSSMILAYVAQPMHRIALALMNEKPVALKDGFDRLVCKAVNALASMYFQAEGCPLVRKIAEALTDLALHSLDAKKGELASYTVGAILNTSLRMMAWDQYGYDSQRLAGRMGVIGSYAINASDGTVAEACASGLMKFDRAYRRRYRGSRDRRHLEEMQELHDQGGILLEEWAENYKGIPQLALDRFKVLCGKTRRQVTSQAGASRKRKTRRSER